MQVLYSGGELTGAGRCAGDGGRRRHDGNDLCCSCACRSGCGRSPCTKPINESNTSIDWSLMMISSQRNTYNGFVSLYRQCKQRMAMGVGPSVRESAVRACSLHHYSVHAVQECNSTHTVSGMLRELLQHPLTVAACRCRFKGHRQHIRHAVMASCCEVRGAVYLEL